MANVYISTVRISDERAITPVVYRRAEVGQVLAPEHHIVWSLFDRDQKERNWLYRRLTDRALRVVSSKVPTSSPYASVVATREQNFDWLQPGMRLVFKVRANAVQRVIVDGKTRKVDVVMHALHPMSLEERRERREVPRLHTLPGYSARARDKVSQSSRELSRSWRTTVSASHAAMLQRLLSIAASWSACSRLSMLRRLGSVYLRVWGHRVHSAAACWR
jgi:hypothetical protein